MMSRKAQVHNVYPRAQTACFRTPVYVLTLVAMDMSTNLSPMLTSMPPMMLGSTFLVITSTSPFLRNAFSADSSSLSMAASKGLAVTTSQGTSPRTAPMMREKAPITGFTKRDRPFSAREPMRFTVKLLNCNFLRASWRASLLTSLLTSGFSINCASLVSCSIMPLNLRSSFSTTSSFFSLEAAEYSAVAYRPSMPNTAKGGLTRPALTAPVVEKWRVKVSMRPQPAMSKVKAAVKTMKLCPLVSYDHFGRKKSLTTNLLTLHAMN
uniref:Uncharacterized protein n=1 Tax=Rhipicephalus zambeziensis TaxID=60191 RepID=A0A224YA19_9ACAR